MVARGATRGTKRGRRPKGSGDSRHGILQAALAEFAGRGYDRATLRAIARRAGVDPALVYHYFGSKEGLFVEAMRVQMRRPTDVELPAAEPTGRQAERVVRLFLERWGGEREPTPLVALLRSASADPKAATLLRQLFARQITPQVSGLLPQDEVGLRVALIGSILFGVAFLRQVIRLEPLASASAEDVGRWVGPALARYVSGPL